MATVLINYFKTYPFLMQILTRFSCLGQTFFNFGHRSTIFQCQSPQVNHFSILGLGKPYFSFGPRSTIFQFWALGNQILILGLDQLFFNIGPRSTIFQFRAYRLIKIKYPKKDKFFPFLNFLTKNLILPWLDPQLA